MARDTFSVPILHIYSSVGYCVVYFCLGFVRAFYQYEGENETYIEASAENSGSTLYDKEIRDKPRTRHTKRNV